MKHQQEFEYIILTINDYLNTLPQSSRIAIGERLQHCVAAIEQTLKEADVSPEAADPAK